jgi:hypothetical protein
VSTLIDKIPTGSRGTIGGRGLAPEAESELLVRIGGCCWSSSDSLRVELRSTVWMLVMFCCCCCCCCCVCVSAPSCVHADPDEDDAAANDAMTASPRHDNGRRRPFRDRRLLCTLTVFSAFCTHSHARTNTHTNNKDTPIRFCTYPSKTASKMQTQKEH